MIFGFRVSAGRLIIIRPTTATQICLLQEESLVLGPEASTQTQGLNK